jgi:hypothetical protein
VNKRKISTLTAAGLAGLALPVALGATASGQSVPNCPPGVTPPSPYCQAPGNTNAPPTNPGQGPPSTTPAGTTPSGNTPPQGNPPRGRARSIQAPSGSSSSGAGSSTATFLSTLGWDGLLELGQWDLQFTAPGAGTFSQKGYVVGKRTMAKKKSKTKRTLVFSGTKRFTRKGKTAVRVKLTPNGRKILRSTKSSVRVTLVTTWTPRGKGRRKATQTRQVTLGKKGSVRG